LIGLERARPACKPLPSARRFRRSHRAVPAAPYSIEQAGTSPGRGSHPKEGTQRIVVGAWPRPFQKHRRSLRPAPHRYRRASGHAPR